MKFKNIIFSSVLIVTMIIPNVMGKELKSFKLQLLNIPAEISKNFKGLNKKVILYHQVKQSKEKCP